MFHWQWFILVITIFFVVSNGEERINMRSDPSYKKKRETSEPKKLSRNVSFPLWVTINGLDSVGGKTEYKQISSNLYEFTLPFLVLVKESNVCTNRSAKQDNTNLYPFWVQITEAPEEYANQTVEGRVRLAFPFDLEVTTMSLIGTKVGVKPDLRLLSVRLSFVGSICLCGAVAIGSAVVSTVVGAFVVTNAIRVAINTIWKTAVELFRPHPNLFTFLERPVNVIDRIVGRFKGAIVSFVPELTEALGNGIKKIFQIGGDSLVTFVNQALSLHVIGDARRAINIAIQIFSSLPFIAWRHVTGWKPQQPGVYPEPPIIIVPELPLPPPSEKETNLVIRIYYGQPTIPGFPEYIIVWPGQQEPTVTDSIILRPVIPTLPFRPNIRLVWPAQATNDVRPNFLLIRPGQRFIPGYVNIVIVWPGDPAPSDSDITVIRPGDNTIPNIIGVVLIWPGQPPSVGPRHIYLLPEQRQDPQFPTIIFKYPNDPPPPNVPGIIIVSPPQTEISGYPGIHITWPEGATNPQPETIVLGPDDFQVPGHPDLVILQPGKPQPRPSPGITYIVPGATEVPGRPSITLQWPPQVVVTTFTITTVLIPPKVTVLPGFPEYAIDRAPSSRSRCNTCVRPGDKTLPDNPNVFVVWLDRPTELVLEPSPDIVNSVFVYQSTPIMKRSVGEEPGSLNDVDREETPERAVLRITETDVKAYGRRNTTFVERDLDITLNGRFKFAHEKASEQNPINTKKSQLRQRVQQLFGLSCQ